MKIALSLAAGMFALAISAIVAFFVYSHFRTGYKVRGSKVFFVKMADGGFGYDEIELTAADAATLEALSKTFAKDKNSVFRNARILESADPKTFSLIDHPRGTRDRFSKDAKYVFEFDSVFENADPSTFQPLDGYFAKDAKLVFYKKEIVTGADPTTFSVLKFEDHPGSDYGKDANQVYLKTSIIKEADSQSFVVLGWPFSKDKKNVYADANIIENADPLTFKVVKDPRSFGDKGEDKNGKYDSNGAKIN